MENPYCMASALQGIFTESWSFLSESASPFPDMCSSCQASQTGTQQWPLSFGCCPHQAWEAQRLQDIRFWFCAFSRFHQSALHRARGILQGVEERWDLEPHGESSTGTPRPAEEGKSPPKESWPLLGGGQWNREGRDGALRDGLKCNPLLWPSEWHLKSLFIWDLPPLQWA